MLLSLAPHTSPHKHHKPQPPPQMLPVQPGGTAVWGPAGARVGWRACVYIALQPLEAHGNGDWGMQELGNGLPVKSPRFKILTTIFQYFQF